MKNPLNELTNTELVALQTKICSDPANRNPNESSLYLYTDSAIKKLDLIARQITYNLQISRKANGNPVPDIGYSGRQSKK